MAGAEAGLNLNRSRGAGRGVFPALFDLGADAKPEMRLESEGMARTKTKRARRLGARRIGPARDGVGLRTEIGHGGGGGIEFRRTPDGGKRDVPIDRQEG